MTARIKSKHHPHAALPDAEGMSLISDARLVEIYAAMLKCRILRRRLRTLAGATKLRSAAPGSEAVIAAVTIDLLPDDRVISAAPHFLAALVKGVPLASLLAPFSSRSHSPEKAVDQDFFASGVLAAPSAGKRGHGTAAAHFAAGIAFEGKLAGRGNVAVVLLEDTGTEATWGETLNFAVAHDLPIILVRQAATPLSFTVGHGRGASSNALPAGLPVIPVDGNDAVAVYRVAHEAIAHARRGSGPTVVDCLSFRLPGERKQDSDSIARMKHYLAAKGLRPERIQVKMAAKFTRALQAAAKAARRTSTGRRSRRSK